MRKILEQCPTCGGPLTVTEVQCQRCQTQVRSQYSPCPFCSLTADQLVFVKLIIEKRGNLRELEKVLGISYPTVRGKLEEVAERLAATSVPQGPPPPPAGPSGADEARREILRQVAEGKLSVKEGLARLRAKAPAPAAPEEPTSPESSTT